MKIEGHVENGKIVLDGPHGLVEGTKVRVEIKSSAESIKEEIALVRSLPDTGKTLAERMAASVGTGVDLPADLAARHDHYIHGSGR